MASSLPATQAKPLAWVSEPRGLALWAAMAGFVLDSYDVLLYVFVVQALRDRISLVAPLWPAWSAPPRSSLPPSAASAAGFLSDRIGRRRTLVLTILVYSIGSGGSALATGLGDAIFWRSIVGFGTRRRMVGRRRAGVGKLAAEASR